MRCTRCNGNQWVSVVREIGGVEYDFCAPCPVCRQAPVDDRKSASSRDAEEVAHEAF